MRDATAISAIEVTDFIRYDLGIPEDVLIDGVNVTGVGVGALGGYAARFGFLGTNVNVDFIQEVEVKTAGFSPEYGQSNGGVINAITKSGGNAFSGEIFDYFTWRDLEGSRRHTPAPSSIPNTAASAAD